jgi:4-oxalocrotonate tautomerase
MPYINIKVAGKLTKDQKKIIADKVTAVMFEVAGKKPESTYIVFDQVEREDWAAGGKLLSE